MLAVLVVVVPVLLPLLLSPASRLLQGVRAGNGGMLL
jgi:hypothetical protein